MSDIPNDIKLARARASIFEASVHKHFPRYVDVCTINDALDAYAAERHRHAEVMEEVRKVLEPFAQAALVLRSMARAFGVDDFKDDAPFASGVAWRRDGLEKTITYGDLRAVRALLSRLEER